MTVSPGASPDDRDPDDDATERESRIRTPRRRSGWRPSPLRAAPLLGGLAVGPALALGGAPGWVTPVASTVALTALGITGIDPASARSDRLVRMFALLALVALVQLVPLPPWLLHAIDARSALATARALAPFGIGADRWRPLHLDPGNGLVDLHLVVGLAAAYLAAKRFTVNGGGETLAIALRSAPLVVCVVALVHVGLGLDRVYAVIQPVYTNPPILSPFINPNHLAAFAGFGTVLWAGVALDVRTLAARIGAVVAALICGAVCASSLSRGGVATTIGALVLLVALVTGLRGAPKRGRAQRLFLGASIVAVIVAAGLFVALEALRHEYAGGNFDKLTAIAQLGRLSLAHPWLGVGSGAVHAVASLESGLVAKYTIDRAENVVVDMALGFGIPATLGVAYLLARWTRAQRPSWRDVQPVRIGALCALIGAVAHDLVDFSLWMPALAFPVVMLAGWLSGLTSGSIVPGARRRPSLRLVVVPVMLASAVLGRFMARSSLDSDRDRVRAGLVAHTLDRATLIAATRRHPADPYLPLASAAWSLEHGGREAVRFVARAIDLAPTWAEPHVLLARAFVATGRRSQAIDEVRAAARLTAGDTTLLARFALSLEPTADDLPRLIPPGAIGTDFLRTLGDNASDAAESTAIDALLVVRAPADPKVLAREAVRRLAAGDRVSARAIYERLVRLAPLDPAGPLGLASIQGDAGELASAESTLRNATGRMPDGTLLYEALATVQTRRRDADGMRATIHHLLDHAGSDIDARARFTALLGMCEAQLGHATMAIAALRRADMIAFPEHPYLPRVIAIAKEAGDQLQLRVACTNAVDLALRDPESLANCRGVSLRGALPDVPGPEPRP